MTTNQQKLTDQQRLNKVILSLERVDQSTKQNIFDMSQGMSDMEIIQNFNQLSLDLFTLVRDITTKMGTEKEYKVGGYKNLFDTAIKVNAKLPIDKFTLMILEFAAEIYNEDDDCFLKMSIPDKEVSVGNEFGLIRSEMFKKLWVTLSKKDQEVITEKTILLTSFAHAYLYKTVQKHLR